MLPDALSFDRYGSLEDIQFLTDHALSSAEGRTVSDLIRFCEEKSVVLAASMPATLELLVYTSLVERDDVGKYRLIGTSDSPDLAAALVERIFSRLVEEKALSSFIQPEAIEYDTVGDSICLRNNLIPLDYSGLKNLLISLGFFRAHPLSANLLQLSKTLEPLFEEKLIPSLKEERFPVESLKGLSLAALMRMQELNELHGREAESFVLEYEKRRVGGSLAERVRAISDLQCDAGYDIVSFENRSSTQPDRFIEVKSYSGEPTFFWSRNEVAVAEVKKGHYFLYLVNREAMDGKEYEPTIIKDPYNEVFLQEKKWSREPMSWFFSKKGS